MKNQEISIKTARLAIKKGVNLISDQTKVLTEKIGAGVVMTGYTLPTQSSLQRWIREEHKIHINCMYTITRGVIKDYGRGMYFWGIIEAPHLDDLVECFETYEKALEVGLYQALKLLEDIKTTF